jgi:hypothetical protein
MRTLTLLLAASILFFACKGKESKNENGANSAPVQDTIKAANPASDTLATNQQNNPSSDMANLLQGKWQSMEDPKNSIEFKGGRKFEYYEGEQPSESTFRFNCDTLESVDLADPSFTYRYLVELHEDRLDLIYLERGNTLRYKKIQ